MNLNRAVASGLGLNYLKTAFFSPTTCLAILNTTKKIAIGKKRKGNKILLFCCGFLVLFGFLGAFNYYLSNFDPILPLGHLAEKKKTKKENPLYLL